MSRPHRLSSFDYTGFWRYLLTVCTWKREPHFRDADVVTMVLNQFLYTGTEQHCELVVFCWRFAKNWGGKLWQDGYHERVLRSEEATAAVARYVIENPVRAGLVAIPEKYPFWGSGTHTREAVLEHAGRAAEAPVCRA